MNSTQMASQYRSQYPQRPPQAAQVRRPQVPPTANPEAIRQERERAARQAEERKMREQEADKRKASRPTDKTMPDGVDQLIVGDGVQQYKELREVERKLDSIMMRSRLDMQDQIPGAMATGGLGQTKKMKIWISNTVENQPWQGGTMEESAFDFNMGVEACYRVKIEGRLIDDDDEDQEGDSDDDEVEKNGDAMDTDGAQTPKFSKQTPTSRKRTKLSHFFQGITVDFERNRHLQPDGMTQVEWKKPQIQPNAPTLPPSADFDSLEFERKSDENINCTINFYRDEQPERFQLSKPLSELLDTSEDDRTSVLMGIWEYIKAMGLQQDEEKRQIQCDDRLRAVFERDTLYFPHIPTLLASHLSPLAPLSVPYTIRVDQSYHSLPAAERYTTYILQLNTPPTIPSTLPSTVSSSTLQDLALKDQHLALLIQAISKTKRKHSFLAQLAKDPVTFTKRWMASQKRDLEVILGEDGRFRDSEDLAGEWVRGGREGVWGKEEVKEAVGVLVSRPDRTGKAF